MVRTWSVGVFLWHTHQPTDFSLILSPYPAENYFLSTTEFPCHTPGRQVENPPIISCPDVSVEGLLECGFDLLHGRVNLFRRQRLFRRTEDEVIRHALFLLGNSLPRERVKKFRADEERARGPNRFVEFRVAR